MVVEQTCLTFSLHQLIISLAIVVLHATKCIQIIHCRTALTYEELTSLAVFQPNNMTGKCMTSFLDNSSVCMQLV